MTSMNVELLLQTNSERDKLLTQVAKLLEIIRDIRITRSRLREFKTNFPDIEDLSTTHNFFLTKSYKPLVPTAFVYAKAIPSIRELNFNSRLNWNIPPSGAFIGDMFIKYKFSDMSTADTLLATNVPRDMVRYCKLPIVKATKKVDLVIDSAVMSSFSRMNMIHYLDHELPKPKLPKVLQMLGNEKKYSGEITPLQGYSEYKLFREYGLGAQTYKVSQPALSMYFPLIFWFNQNPYQALVNKIAQSISVSVDLDSVESIIEFSPKPGSLGVINYPTIISADLYYKDIYVPHEIHEIYVNKKLFEVFSCWSYQEYNLSKMSESISLNIRDSPLERIYMSFVPDNQDMQNWHKGYRLKTVLIPEVINYVNPLPPPNPTYMIDTYLTPVHEEVLPIDSLTVTTYSVTYFQDFGADFFVDYETGFNKNISLGENGSLMIHFDYVPKKGQVSGYSSTANNINFSVKYLSSYFGTLGSGKLYVSFKTINHLLIDTKLLQVRYS